MRQDVLDAIRQNAGDADVTDPSLRCVENGLGFKRYFSELADSRNRRVPTSGHGGTRLARQRSEVTAAALGFSQLFLRRKRFLFRSMPLLAYRAG